MNRFETELFATSSSGRKGVAYDWQSLVASDTMTAIDVELREFALEPAE